MGRGPEPASTHFQKNNDRESILHRKDGFTKNLGGYTDGKTPWPNNVHHTLVCCTFYQSSIEEELNDPNKARYVNDCLWATPWDINRGNNLLLLPLWGAYINNYRNASSVPPQGPEKLPAHNRDHNGKQSYTTEIKQWLKNNIWNSLSVQKEPHKVDIETILAQLEQGENKWKSQLATRATRQNGTWAAWNDRKTNPLWVQAFSMTKKAWVKPRTAP